MAYSPVATPLAYSGRYASTLLPGQHALPYSPVATPVSYSPVATPLATPQSFHAMTYSGRYASANLPSRCAASLFPCRCIRHSPVAAPLTYFPVIRHCRLIPRSLHTEAYSRSLRHWLIPSRYAAAYSPVAAPLTFPVMRATDLLPIHYAAAYSPVATPLHTDWIIQNL
ncbi:hypothetical protein AVEN_210676-1 [Araneus ventricosus]|uniref:Uncharacterized protein n=1 Tax=Araneus ventricosus TaxID=182803 RepID=A0A4Y2VLV9_ARAVE|nr:hypothetical protein AVEN_210676-1 [Araneus ventricosus]